MTDKKYEIYKDLSRYITNTIIENKLDYKKIANDIGITEEDFSEILFKYNNNTSISKLYAVYNDVEQELVKRKIKLYEKGKNE